MFERNHSYITINLNFEDQKIYEDDHCNLLSEISDLINF